MGDRSWVSLPSSYCPGHPANSAWPSLHGGQNEYWQWLVVREFFYFLATLYYSKIWGSFPSQNYLLVSHFFEVTIFAVAFDLRKRWFMTHQVAVSTSDSTSRQITRVHVLVLACRCFWTGSIDRIRATYSYQSCSLPSVVWWRLIVINVMVTTLCQVTTNEPPPCHTRHWSLVNVRRLQRGMLEILMTAGKHCGGFPRTLQPAASTWAMPCNIRWKQSKQTSTCLTLPVMFKHLKKVSFTTINSFT